MNYIAYRVFEFFEKKDSTLSIFRTINFLTLFQVSFLVPIFILFNSFLKEHINTISTVDRIEYYLGIPLGIVFILFNSFLYKKKLTGESLSRLKEKFHKEKYSLSVWVFFLTPVILVFVIPIVYGLLNGTIRVVHP